MRSRPRSEEQKRPASRSTPGQSRSGYGSISVYIPARRSSASLRSIFFRAAMAFRFRLAEGFS